MLTYSEQRITVGGSTEGWASQLSGDEVGLSQRKSLNKDVRKRDLLKITQENSAILRRLQGTSSMYSVK